MSAARFWIGELIWAVVLSVAAVSRYPDESGTLEQAIIQGGTVITGSVLALLLILVVGWVAFAPRHQRDDAWGEVEAIRERQDWVQIIAEITSHMREGNRAMEIHGRPHTDYILPLGQGPPVDHVGNMLQFMNTWIPAVNQTLEACPEYMADFENDGREIFLAEDRGGQVAVAISQLEVRVRHLREVVQDIRANRL